MRSADRTFEMSRLIRFERHLDSTILKSESIGLTRSPKITFFNIF